MSRIEVITGVERRRRYSDAELAAILTKCEEPGSTIVGVAKMLGISPSLIHTWKRMRREAERIASEPMQFIPYGSVQKHRITPKPSREGVNGGAHLSLQSKAFAYTLFPSGFWLPNPRQQFVNPVARIPLNRNSSP